MTIREWICKNEARMFEQRLESLEAMNAPKVMIEAQRKAVDELKAGKIEVGGEKNLLDVEFESFIQKKGNGGKTYLTINGKINYFPQAQYGRYIKTASK